MHFAPVVIFHLIKLRIGCAFDLVQHDAARWAATPKQTDYGTLLALERIFGDALPEKSHGVMTAVFIDALSSGRKGGM